MGVSGLPFFFLPHHKMKTPISLSGLFEWLRRPEHRNEIISIFGRSIEEKVSLTFYPIFIFFIVGTYTKQGFMAAASMAVGTVAVFLAGKFMDRPGNRKRFLFGVVGTSLIWPLKFLARTFGSLLALDVISSAISPFYWVNFESLVYKDVRKNDESSLMFMTARLVVTGLAYLTVLVVVLVTAFTRYNFLILFTLAAFGSLLSYYIWEGKNEKH
jgi:MFS family permease